MKSDNLQDRAYQALRDRISTGRYRPGTFLSENTLAADLGVSRTPLRGAIQQLELEGLLECRPRIGTFVRMIERDELEDLYDVRMALETLSAERAAEHCTEEDLEPFAALVARAGEIADRLRAEGRESCSEEEEAELLAADLELHQFLVSLGGNRWVYKILGDMHVLTLFFGARRLVHTAAIVEGICDHHAAILDALRRRDGAGAAAAMRTHIEQSKADMQRQFGRGATPGGLARTATRGVDRLRNPTGGRPTADLERHLTDVRPEPKRKTQEQPR